VRNGNSGTKMKYGGEGGVVKKISPRGSLRWTGDFVRGLQKRRKGRKVRLKSSVDLNEKDKKEGGKTSYGRSSALMESSTKRRSS